MRELCPVLDFLFELPGGDKFPPGDMNILALFDYFGVLGDFDGGKTRVIRWRMVSC